MITLYHFKRVWGIPDLSPFCVKVETYMRMAGIEYENDTSFDIRKAPKGKFPLIKHEGKLIPDSSVIIDYLKKQFGNSVDEHLTPDEVAQGILVQRLLEEHFYWVAFYLRWGPEEAWQELKPVIFEGLPFPLSFFIPSVVRKEALKTIYGQGLGRHSVEDMLAFAREDLDVLVQVLGDKKYISGDKVSSFDAIVYGFLVNLLYCPIASPLADYAQTKPSLKDYTLRLNREYYADMPLK